MKTKFENSSKTFISAIILCFILMIWKKTSDSYCYKKKMRLKQQQQQEMLNTNTQGKMEVVKISIPS